MQTHRIDGKLNNSRVLASERVRTHPAAGIRRLFCFSTALVLLMLAVQALQAQMPPRPLLVIHGTADSITPFELGEALFAAASEPKTFRVVDGGGHVTPWVAEGERFELALVEFFGAAIAR